MFTSLHCVHHVCAARARLALKSREEVSVRRAAVWLVFEFCAALYTCSQIKVRAREHKHALPHNGHLPDNGQVQPSTTAEYNLVAIRRVVGLRGGWGGEGIRSCCTSL